MICPRRSLYVAAMILLMTLLYFLMFLFTPIQVDDLMFAQEYISANNESPDFSIQGAWNYILFVRDQINGRIPNMVCAFWVLHLHHTAGSLLLASATVAMFAVMGCLASRRLTVTALAVAWCIGALLLPWRSGMFITDMALNYLPVSLAILWVFREFTHPSRIPLWLLLPLVFFSGLLHEGASLIAIAACGAYALMHRLRLSGRQWTIAVVFLVGTALLLTSPGIWLRFDGAHTTGMTLKSVLFSIPLTLSLLCSVPILLMWRPWRPILRSLLHTPRWLACCVASLVGAAMQWQLGFAFERGAWFGETFACVALLTLILAILHASHRCIRTVATLLAILIPSALLCGSIAMQHRASVEHHTILRLLKQSPTGTVFCNIHPLSSRTLLNYPMTYTWINPDHLLIVNNRSSRPIAVVPEELVHASPSTLSPVPGSAAALRFGQSYLLPDRNLHMLDAHGIPYPNCPVELTDYTYTLADGTIHRGIKTLLQRFTLTDGTTMLLVRPLDLRLPPPYLRIDR